MLTPEQQKMVEDNHNLIYLVIHENNLELSEWYDLLAIELCNTVQSFDPKRGSLIGYYKKRCKYRIIKEYNKKKSKKRDGGTLYSIEDLEENKVHKEPCLNNFENDVLLQLKIKELLESDYGDIIKLRLEGYNQTEIAEKISMSQATVSGILSKIKENLINEEYYEK